MTIDEELAVFVYSCCLHDKPRTFEWCIKNCCRYYSCDTVAMAEDRYMALAHEKAQDAFFAETNCQRCGKELKSRIMSKMNENVICPECADAEKKHPLYEEAEQAELAEVKAGNYNYPGLFAGKNYPFN